MMTDKEFIDGAYKALYSKTMYVNGAFGAPATAYNKARYSNKNNSIRIYKIQNAPLGTYFFDCVCLVKGLLWGWRADPHDRNGGAIYASNGVPDVGEDSMIRMCTYSSTDFAGIVPGAVVWLPGHIGIYVGDGLVIEATAAYTANVLMTCCGNVGRKSGYPVRTWTKWGMLPWVKYTEEEDMTREDTEKLIREMFPGMFNENMERYNKELMKKPADGYAKDALKWAKDNGIMIGNTTGNQMPQSSVKREDLAVVLYAQEKNNG